MIAIVDYGLGNVFSLSSSLDYLGIENKITADAEEWKNADQIILPGVGAFSDAMDKLNELGAVDTLRELAGTGKPFLGICLGMQLLFEKSYEYGEHVGLGLIPGEVISLEEALKAEGITDLKVPHMGWNALRIRQEVPLLKYTEEGEHMYYVHSFFASGCDEYTAAGSEYGVWVPGTVVNGNVMGCQFHPEKSGEKGLKILRAFSEM